LTSGRM